MTSVEFEQLLDACLLRLNGNPEFRIFVLRDRLAIGLMIAAGLRSDEAASLIFDDILKQDKRTVLNIKGKGAKDRVVPTSDRLADWRFLVGPNGHVLRSPGRNRVPGESASTIGFYNIVQKRGKLIGKPNLQPHDLRLTYAELGRRTGVSIEQINRLLGHATIKTAQDYLNIELDLETTTSDFLPF